MNTLRSLAWYLALVVSCIVAVLSYFGGVSLLQIVLRSILAYVVLYGISELSLILFEKTSPPTYAEVGALLDIAVGQEHLSDSELSKAPLPGQVDQELAQGLPSEEKQAEIVRRMGWGE